MLSYNLWTYIGTLYFHLINKDYIIKFKLFEKKTLHTQANLKPKSFLANLLSTLF